MKRINFDEIERRVINEDQVAKEIGNHCCKSLKEICVKHPVELCIFTYERKGYVLYRLEFWLYGRAIAKFPLNKLYCPSVDKSYYDTVRRILKEYTMKAYIHELNKELRYFVIDETKDVSYEQTVKNLKSALNREIQNPDYMATCGEMQRLEHDRLIIEAL